jgi:hypothetical protein
VGVGSALFGLVTSSTSVLVLFPFMALIGLGMGPSMAAVGLLAQNSVPKADTGTATSSMMLFKAIGQAVGLTQALSPYELARETASTFGLDASLIRPATLASYASPDARPYARHLNVSGARAQRLLGGPFRSVTPSLAALYSQCVAAAA